METINTMSNGMNSDVSKQVHSNDSYLQALNFRPLTELGGSNGSLVNIKGNECKLTFPNIEAIYKLILIPGSLITNNNTITFTINGVTSSSLTITNSTNGFDIYNFIILNYTNCYQNTSVGTKTFAISYDDNYVVIYQQPEYKTCSPVSSVPVTITTTYSNATSGAFPVIKFTDGDIVNNSITQNLINPFIKSVNSSLVIPIGSTFILNETYLFTATDNPIFGLGNGPNPLVEIPENDSFKYDGAIWKLLIDDITKEHTLTLLYANHLDFTKYHPIPPSATSGRYESGSIKRIYWSDNYSKIRTLNIAMPQLMALSSSILNVMPKVEYTQGILSSIITGSLEAGCYQMGYRLSKVLGSTTNFSELSNLVYLTTNQEYDSFVDYMGSAGSTSKGIAWTLSNLDTNYDQIEFVVVYRSYDTAIPTITSTGLTTLLPSMTFSYTISTGAAFTSVTLEEFLLFNGTFTHAKTCDTKDNRLFWGNVRAPRKSLDSFDSRAFRANAAGQISLTNLNVNIDHPNLNAAIATEISSDAINTYYDISGNYSTKACYLKPELIGLPTKLGGAGKNISYEFGTTIFNSDNDLNIDTSTNWDLSRSGAPFRGAAPTTSNPTGLIYNYPQNGKFQVLKQPERTSLLKGFQHEEIYRFGIQFFDKEGNPYFTNWIGDIKMPSYGDVNSNPDGPVNDFRLSFAIGPNMQYQQVLYIKFTVNISSISDLISGYEIVRVKRVGSDKTIHGVGMINPMTTTQIGYDGGDVMIPAGWDGRRGDFIVPGPITLPNTRYYRPYPGQAQVETLNINSDYDTTANSETGKLKSFDCWDFDAGLAPIFAPGDKILIRSRLKCINYRGGSYPNSAYRMYFGSKGHVVSSGNEVPANNAMINNGTVPPFTSASNNDSGVEPFFIMKMLDDTEYCTYNNFLNSTITPYDYTIIEGVFISGNSTGILAGRNILNYGKDIDSNTLSGGPTGNPCFGKQSLFVYLNRGLYTSTYDCFADDVEFKKLLGLYYKPNFRQYGGPTYIDRTSNVYIPCSEYVATIQAGLPINTTITTFKCFGGDIFTGIYDSMKTVKATTAGSDYKVYNYNTSGVYGGLGNKKAMFSTTFFYPITSSWNVELRIGLHTNKDLTALNGVFGWGNEDGYQYQRYCNTENDVKTYFPKPLNFQVADEWINRIYFSEIKINNELQDSWSEYHTNSLYDVEGNYGPINALISLKENMYYIQERGIGMLMINPVSMINDQVGTPIKLGSSNDVIQKHYYKSIDSGTSHQWSVYRSQSTITFVDVRHKKIYLFNGETVIPISDLKGQRNFTIKRLHNELLKNDNPVINKGILVTYDYYHNEFLYTFNNVKITGLEVLLDYTNLILDTTNNENLTLAYSEVSGNFSGLYSFTPNLYINTNKYLISTKNLSISPTEIHNKLWFHNYGIYANFYGTQYPSTIKLITNDDPIITKVFDNAVWNTESIKDNIEWNDDLNIYPGSPTSPTYVDDVNHQLDTFTKIRCYNDYQNTDWINLSLVKPNNNLTRKERDFNLQIPRNRFNYDTNLPSVSSLFDTSKLTKLLFGERMRDKYLIIDLYYPNSIGNRFVINNLKSIFRKSDR